MGCHLAFMQISASTGRMTLATATLLENSVRMDAKSDANTITENFGSCARPPRCTAISLLIPELLEPSANAKPPPKRKMRPHGSFCCTTFQVIRGADGAVGFLDSSLLKK
ncbi:hypothetical protein Trydic_g18382 [Trypoxylus dichotomus]